MDFDKLLEEIQIEVEMAWIALDWWATVNKIERRLKCQT